MTPEELDSHPDWKWCTVEGAELSVRLAGLRSSFREKLEWLEAAETLSLRFPINRARALAQGRIVSENIKLD